MSTGGCVHKVCVYVPVCVCVRMCVFYLAEGQTVFILVFVFDLKVIQRFALGWSLTQGTQQLDVTGRQETMATVELAMVPVIVHLASQDDDVTLGKLEIAWFFSLIGIQGFPTRESRNILKDINTCKYLIYKQIIFYYGQNRENAIKTPLYYLCWRETDNTLFLSLLALRD